MSHFVNPYNFVRGHAASPVPRQTLRPHTATGDELLSGELSCLLENLTPLALNGQRDAKTGEVRALRLGPNGTPVIPAATLKGMVRSAFETVAGGCLLFTSRQDWEGRPANPEVPASLGLLRRLPTPEQPGEIEVARRILVVPHILRQAKVKVSDSGEQLPTECPKVFVKCSETRVTEMRQATGACPEGFVSGWINLTGPVETPSVPLTHDFLRKRGFTVKDYGRLNVLSYSRGPSPKPGEPGPVTNISRELSPEYTGYLQANRKTGLPELKPLKKSVVAIPTGELLPVSYEEYQRYLAINRHGQRARQNTLGLVVEQVLYFTEATVGGAKVASKIRRTALGREAWDTATSALLPEHQVPCTTLLDRQGEKLHDPRVCPACQVFGFAAQHLSYAGHLRFSSAQMNGVQPAKVQSAQTLKTLAAPRTSSTGFYLSGPTDASGTPPMAPGSQWRGRKVYVARDHRKLRPDDYLRKVSVPGEPTIKAELLDAGQHFSFTLQFEGLTSEELQTLLFSLVLDGRASHGLGIGKPLGLGAVKLQVTTIRLKTADYAKTLVPARRWSEAELKDILPENARQEFCVRPPVQDLLRLRTGELRRDDAPVKYPGPEGKGHEWFARFLTPGQRPVATPAQLLPLPADMDTQGTPEAPKALFDPDFIIPSSPAANKPKPELKGGKTPPPPTKAQEKEAALAVRQEAAAALGFNLPMLGMSKKSKTDPLEEITKLAKSASPKDMRRLLMDLVDSIKSGRQYNAEIHAEVQRLVSKRHDWHLRSRFKDTLDYNSQLLLLEELSKRKGRRG